MLSQEAKPKTQRFRVKLAFYVQVCTIDEVERNKNTYSLSNKCTTVRLQKFLVHSVPKIFVNGQLKGTNEKWTKSQK